MDEIIREVFGVEQMDRKTIVRLLRKSVPLNPLGDLDSVPHFRCPTCNRSVKCFVDSPEMPHCSWCGQALDWS